MSPISDVLDDLFVALESEIKQLGYEKYLNFLRICLQKGLSYERQREVFRRTESDEKLKEVVKVLTKEFELNYPIFIR